MHYLARLKSLIDYCPETGEFTWKNGKPAGSVNDNGYLIIGIDYTRYRAHRLAFLFIHGYMPDQVDHEDHDTLNNRGNNLRDATHAENMQNRGMHENNTSGCCGVYPSRNKWRAEIRVNNKKVGLGSHSDINAAILTRKVAEFAYGFHANHGKQYLAR